jgi:hypothetical protein
VIDPCLIMSRPLNYQINTRSWRFLCLALRLNTAIRRRGRLPLCCDQLGDCREPG